MNKVKAWFLLFRPWSYTATLIPFAVAAGLLGVLGLADGDCYWGHWTLGLVAGILFQATVNLLNTWGDERSGVDSAPGAICTTPQIREGLVSMRALLLVALGCAFAASVLGVSLCFYRAPEWQLNVPLLIAGFIGLLGSTNYSTGIKFKYHGLGVPFVSFLMGPLEIFVAFSLLEPDFAREMLMPDPAMPLILLMAILLTLPISSLVGVIMHGNDMRDIPSDRAAGIVTLASWLGPRKALGYYRICHLLPYGVTCLNILLFGNVLNNGTWAYTWAWLPFLCLPLTAKTLRTAAKTYRECPESPKWRGLERASGGIHLVYGLLYALALYL
ncbi:MAG: prenyltransferase [Kiritimatiellae bacterium]|nr:prenyltransferase [Kiritimatiellia bacterium]